MKRSLIIITASFISLFLCSVAQAAWQVASPSASMPSEPFFQTGSQQTSTQFISNYGVTAYPNHYANAGYPAQMYAISISGSIKENIERIMDRYHWRVIWRAPYDYNFDGRITGASLPDVMRKLLKPFPLQAQLYMSNHTMVVIQRNV
ncbi:MAG: hypothetical protein SFW66_04485 [Gammaproteobacteria bacterium]|nr:hypothetical protein [Gammaproteobacteria bacterium]